MDKPMYKIEIITRPHKLDELKKSLNEIGITGMTVSQVMGCGIQKGATEIYRGHQLEMNLLHKVKIEIVVSKIPVDDVIDAATSVLKTGEIGDGKIFVSEIQRVVRIRTGQQNFEALQDD